ncbi:MAG: hypothetical protein A2381_04810 [Bdellovibrionales bacterium RIFOXYB1_FULL_37_110]|nr:MAG: hypothetical protein A2181_01240 [Bdellovibrionales bacterium RIFOXYA1_FULL_38_20]OFZ50505.1 MAG: hypothetical protein A2417_10790 [Bdellovibrionales bacterium RIFOXYC1_FULL_37_79]OFZ60776.1 MAG: hypothetical protein A2381_04810 [Bdellovibrionales bacterium RIFOXYB1_FULL_37_110]OFZ64490.1 MAG: hypothetical protein A2577_08775 [Bdellovibrionales bacterium RIFOXYD1_FULL_36_51]
MDARISAYYPCINNVKTVPVFGYATKGIPGLEIIGLGKYGKNIKEKFVYLARKEKIKIPLKRYVVCIEGDLEDIDHILLNNRWFELPIFIVYWSMAELLPIKKLDNCLCAGKIDITGKIINADYSGGINWLFDDDHSYKLIAPQNSFVALDIPIIPLEEILRNIKYLKIL